MPPKITHEQYKEAFDKKFAGVLELRDSKYISAREPIIVYCLLHGAFERGASALLYDDRPRHPCPDCVKELQRNDVLADWPNYLSKIQQAIDCANLDFTRVDYRGSQKKIEIICSLHGPFEAIPANILHKKSGCPDCGRSNRANLGPEEILSRLIEAHGDKYEFDIPPNVRTTTKISYKCEIHGKKYGLVTNLLAGKGCRECGRIAAVQKRSITTEQWIEKARKVHGQKYDYSKTKYLNAKVKVIVTCPDHGDFEINPSNHIQPSLKRGCKGCSGGKFSNWDNAQKRLSQDSFIKRVSYAAPLNLDFSKAIYRGLKKTVTVVCKLHGEFEAWPSNLFSGQNCSECASAIGGKKRRLSSKDIKERITQRFGKKYIIDQSSIKMATEPVRLKCSKHGWFDGLIGNLISSSGCPKCTHEKTTILRSRSQTLSKEKLIARFRSIHGNFYDYSKTEPEGTQSSVLINCKKHGEFPQRVYSHLEGKGCPSCGAERKIADARLSQGEIYARLSKINGGIFIYPPNCGLDLKEKIPIICREHGIFYQPLRIHLKGNGCSECSQSLGAKRVSQWLRNHEVIYEVEFKIPAGDKGLPLRADFFLPEHNLFIEYDGEQHFRPISFFGMDEETPLHVFHKQKERDEAKTKWIKINGFDLLRIKFDQDVFEELDFYFFS